MKLILNNKEFECVKAVKGIDYIHLYDNEKVIAEFVGISNFDGYELQDESGNPIEYELPPITQSERLATVEETLYVLLGGAI